MPSVQRRAPSQPALVIAPGGEEGRAEEQRRGDAPVWTLSCPLFTFYSAHLPSILLLFSVLWYNTLAVVTKAGCNVG